MAADGPLEAEDAIDLSQTLHRRVIGFLGLFLPALLLIVSAWRPTEGEPRVLSSVSSYYYSGGVSLFVGVVFALSLFLFTYRGYKGTNADRIVGGIAGLAAFLVACFPTDPPDGIKPPDWWHGWIGWVHLVSAVVLFGCFILFAIWLFRKSSEPDRRKRAADKNWRDRICLGCGIIMILAVSGAILAKLTHHSIFLPESIAIEGFAVSWLVKSEIHRPIIQMAQRLSGAGPRS
jgi:hypothetical protein